MNIATVGLDIAKQFGGMDVSQAQEAKQLRDENTRRNFLTSVWVKQGGKWREAAQVVKNVLAPKTSSPNLAQQLE